MIGEFLAILKTVIIKEKLYDNRNPCIVLGSQELEKALDRKALHISELTDRIMSQIAWAENYSMGFFKGAFPFLEPSQKNSLSRRTSSVATRIETHEGTLFRLKPKFLKVIQGVERCYQSRKVFTFKEVTKLLAKYIFSRKDNIFDTRNLTVAWSQQIH